MKLIADSGSTNTIWYYFDGSDTKTFTTKGYNPFYCSSNEIHTNLSEDLLPLLKNTDIKQVFFYGAGCSNNKNKAIVSEALSKAFQQASIDIGSDLLAAARATAQHNHGVCCILGTGSNSCYYDGKKIIDNVPPLGYILGDEGGGVGLGRLLLQAYYYRELPEDLSTTMNEFADMDRGQLLQQVFNGEMPSRFIASFSIFAVQNRTHPFIQKLIKDNFNTFVKRHILKYANAALQPVHFVGSVAFGFQNELKEILSEHKLQVGKIIKSPFPDLLLY